MDLSKLRLNEINLDVFMKYFKDGYISSSLLNPDKFPVSLKWFKYTFTKNDVSYDFYSLYKLNLTPVNNENGISNIDELNNYFSVRTITDNSTITESVTDEKQIYMCNANLFTTNCKVLYTPSKYCFIKTNENNRLFYNVEFNINDYYDRYNPNTVKNFDIRLNNVLYQFNQLSKINNENDQYYKDGITVYRLVNSIEVVGYLIENDIFYTNIDKQGRALYKDVHGNTVIGNDEPTIFETHVSQIRNEIQKGGGTDALLKYGNYPAYQEIIVLDRYVDANGYNRLNYSSKVIDEVEIYTQHELINDNTITDIGAPTIMKDTDYTSLMNGNTITVDNIKNRYVYNIFQSHNLKTATLYKIKSYNDDSQYIYFSTDNYNGNYKIEELYPKLKFSENGEEYEMYYDDTNSKYYISPTDKTDLVEIYKYEDNFKFYISIPYSSLVQNGNTYTMSFGKTKSLTINKNSYGEWQLEVHNYDNKNNKIVDGYMYIPIEIKDPIIIPIISNVDHYLTNNNEISLDIKNIIGSKMTMNPNISNMLMPSYTFKSINNVLYTTNLIQINEDADYIYYKLSEKKYRYLYDAEKVIKSTKIAKVSKLRNTDITSNFNIKNYYDGTLVGYDGRICDSVFLLNRGKIVTKQNKLEQEKNLFLKMLGEYIENKELDINNKSKYSTEYVDESYQYLQAYYNLFSNEDKYYSSYISKLKREIDEDNKEYKDKSLDKLILIKNDSVSKELDDDHELKRYEEYSLTQSEKFKLDEQIDTGNVYSRLLDYSKYSTINEYKDYLYNRQLLNNVYSDHDTSKHYDDGEYIPKIVLKKQLVGRMKFKPELTKLLISYFENDHITGNGHSWYINSYMNFYYNKIKNTDIVNDIYTDNVPEKLVYNISDGNLSVELINNLINKIIEGDWSIL